LAGALEPDLLRAAALDVAFLAREGRLVPDRLDAGVRVLMFCSASGRCGGFGWTIPSVGGGSVLPPLSTIGGIG
jgi:hypothetical protein